MNFQESDQRMGRRNVSAEISYPNTGISDFTVKWADMVLITVRSNEYMFLIQLEYPISN